MALLVRVEFVSIGTSVNIHLYDQKDNLQERQHQRSISSYIAQELQMLPLYIFFKQF